MFNSSIVLLFNDWLQGREKFVMVYKGFSIVLLSAPRFKKEHFVVQKPAKVIKYCVLQFDHAQECVCDKFCQQ